MKKLRLTYRIATPCFLGGAAQQPEFRLASFKGVLRFWWRTLQWGRFTDAKAMKEEEDSIFGSADRNFGRSKVQLRLTKTTPDKLVTQATRSVLWQDDQPQNSKGNEKRPGAFYLGYGCINPIFNEGSGDKAGQLIRGCLMPFEFELAVRIRCNDQQTQSVEAALAMMGLLGGLGSKSRKGYGSLSLVNWTTENGGADPEWLDLSSPAAMFEKIAGNWMSSKVVPDWTAFSKGTRVLKLELAKKETTARTLLDAIGSEMMLFRCWGYGGKVVGKDAEQRFWEDRDLHYMKTRPGKIDNLTGNGPITIEHPRRVAFGLPHNYGENPQNPEGSMVYPVMANNQKVGDGRRASPLIIHIHQPDPSQSPVAFIAAFPTKFLPDDIPLRAFGDEVPVSQDDFYKPITDFMDRLEGISTDDKNKTKTGLKATRVL